MKGVFLSLALASVLTAQDLVSNTAKIENGMVSAGAYQVPIFKGVKDAYLIKYSDGSLQVNFSIMIPDGPNAAEQESRDREALIKFYAGRTIFGVKATQFEDGREFGAAMASAICNKASSKPSLLIRLIGGEEQAGNTVMISNKCRRE
jgi:hypothetical protein